jgi:F1F0 ATPase subunit 2
MNFPLSLLLAFIAGLVLGLIYYAGLWVTIQRLPQSNHPGVLAAVSLFLRLGLVLVAFYLVMGGRWERLLACLAGFLLARTLLTRRLGPRRQFQETKR